MKVFSTNYDFILILGKTFSDGVKASVFFFATYLAGFGVTILTSDFDHFLLSLEGELDILDFRDFFGDLIENFESLFESYI